MDLQVWCAWYKRRGAGRLRRVLMREWDPIGVGQSPQARDEYDSYLGQIAERLRRGEDVTAFLEAIRTSSMGLPPNRAVDARASAVVRQWYDAETARR